MSPYHDFIPRMSVSKKWSSFAVSCDAVSRPKLPSSFLIRVHCNAIAQQPILTNPIKCLGLTNCWSRLHFLLPHFQDHLSWPMTSISFLTQLTRDNNSFFTFHSQQSSSSSSSAFFFFTKTRFFFCFLFCQYTVVPRNSTRVYDKIFFQLFWFE